MDELPTPLPPEHLQQASCTRAARQAGSMEKSKAILNWLTSRCSTENVKRTPQRMCEWDENVRPVEYCGGQVKVCLTTQSVSVSQGRVDCWAETRALPWGQRTISLPLLTSFCLACPPLTSATLQRLASHLPVLAIGRGAAQQTGSDVTLSG